MKGGDSLRIVFGLSRFCTIARPRFPGIKTKYPEAPTFCFVVSLCVCYTLHTEGQVMYREVQLFTFVFCVPACIQP